MHEHDNYIERREPHSHGPYGEKMRRLSAYNITMGEGTRGYRLELHVPYGTNAECTDRVEAATHRELWGVIFLFYSYIIEQ